MRPTNRAESALSRKRSERMASATTTALVDLPDAALLLILESVAPKQLARVCLVCHDLARLAREEALWAEVEQRTQASLARFWFKYWYNFESESRLWGVL